MKLHHLRLHGIGPFRDPVGIDIAALGAGGMFLLEGPTGSGKSTILDAIVYALYGTVAGDGASGDRIRSQFADPGTASMIDLIFETGQGIFRVLRYPEYQRAKKRGTGTTRQQAKALLWRLTSPELIPAVVADSAGQGAGAEPIATRLDDVGREITAALGLSREQFTQTVLLPQGEFARFLRARTGDRQEVLQRVFGTEIYEDIEKQLEQMRRDAAAQVTEAKAGLGQAVARFAEASALADEAREPLEEQAEALRHEELTAEARRITQKAEAAAEGANTQAAIVRRRESEARAAADAAAARLSRIDRRRALDRLGAALTAQAEAADEARDRLERDRIARPVAGAITRRDRARDLQREREQAVADALALHRDDHTDLVSLAEGEEPLPALAGAAQQATSRAGALDALVELEKNLPERERERTTRGDELASIRTVLAALDQQIAGRPEARRQLMSARDTARAEAEGLADAREAVKGMTERLDQARAAERLAHEVEQAETAARTAQRAAEAAAEEEARLRRRRNAGLAAELALDLTEGAPCPVCGAVEHPHRAETGADHVDAETVEAAEEERRAAESAASAAREQLALAGSRHESAVDRAGGLSVDDALAARKEATTALESIEGQQAEAMRLERALEAHEEESRALAARREQQALAVEGEASALKALATSIDEDRERVREARGGASSVQAQRRAYTDRSRVAHDLREALLAADQAAARARELAAEVDLGDFPDDEAVHRACLAEDTRRKLEALLTRRATDQTRYEDGMAEEGVVDADPSEEARAAAAEAVEATGAAVSTARTATAEADQESGRLTAIARAAAAARERLDLALAQVATVSEKAGAVVRIADLATGRSADGDRIQLSTYVLMRRFEDVIAAANTRLALFSNTDLELVRDTAARGARKTGLDLLVIDRRTDQARVPETLSGGETFFVSLALALGLADIVTAEAGGVQMDTLFIDEGFGSLDPESLERVVAEIGTLASHGRTIGLVSHVSEMKQQIAEQVHVRRRPDGSSTLTVTA